MTHSQRDQDLDGRTDYAKPPAHVNSERFRMSFWRWLIIMLVFAQVLYTPLLVVTLYLATAQNPFVLVGFWTSYVSGAGVITILAALVVGLYVWVWDVRVHPDTLRGWDIWGRFATVTWDSIHTVKPFRWPFLPALRVYSTETRRVIWLPLFVIQAPRFAQRIAEYAGPDHPLTGLVRLHMEPEE